MLMKARSRPAGQLSETTTRKFGGNQILAMKICNSLLNKCFHGKALFTRHSSPSARRDAVQLGRQCPEERRGVGAALANLDAAGRPRERAVSPCLPFNLLLVWVSV